MRNSSAILYVINLALLATHQADAAYQHEWLLFQVPGGIHSFLAFNLVAVFLLALGLIHVANRTRFENLSVYGISGVGVFTFLIHILFIGLGHLEFRDPLSFAILILILIVSIVQPLVARRNAVHF